MTTQTQWLLEIFYFKGQTQTHTHTHTVIIIFTQNIWICERGRETQLLEYWILCWIAAYRHMQSAECYSIMNCSLFCIYAAHSHTHTYTHTDTLPAKCKYDKTMCSSLAQGINLFMLLLLLLLILNSHSMQCQSIPHYKITKPVYQAIRYQRVASNTQHVAKLIERMLLAYLSIICLHYDNSKKNYRNNTNKKK